MGQSKSKLKCLYLPAQSGKTRKIEEEIKKNKLLNDFLDTSDDINFFISANVRLLVCQTATRLNNDLVENDEIINNSVFTWISGNKECNLRPKELANDITDDEIEMVIMCAHEKRIKYLADLILILSKKPKKLDGKKINIWIDEADVSITTWSKYEDIIEKDIIHSVTLVSATFGSVFKKYNTLPVMGYQTTHPECYRCLKDSKQIVVNYAGSAVEYIDFVLKNNEYLCSPGKRAFIPGDYKKESHYQIRDLLFHQYNFCILLINGDQKTLFTREKDMDLSDFFSTSGDTPEEFNTILADLYITHDLFKHPFAITGMECIKRGVTFQCEAQNNNKGFLFDYGIVPNISKKEEAYQSMARLFGNVGNFKDYKPVEIFSTTSNFKKIKKQEEIAINLARIVYENNIEEVDTSILNEAGNISQEVDKNLYRIYSDEEVVRDVCKILGYTYKPVKDNEDGFKETSINKKRKVESLKDVIKAVPNAWGTVDGEVVYRRYFPCYKNITDKNSLMFVVIIQPGISEEKIKKCDQKYNSTIF